MAPDNDTLIISIASEWFSFTHGPQRQLQDQIQNMGSEEFPIWENAEDIEESRKASGEAKVALTNLREMGQTW